MKHNYPQLYKSVSFYFRGGADMPVEKIAAVFEVSYFKLSNMISERIRANAALKKIQESLDFNEIEA